MCSTIRGHQTAEGAQGSGRTGGGVWGKDCAVAVTDGNTGAYQVSVYKKHGEIHQNPGREHEDDGVKAQDVEQPQVVDPSVSQHLLKEKSVENKVFWRQCHKKFDVKNTGLCPM